MVNYNCVYKKKKTECNTDYRAQLFCVFIRESVFVSLLQIKTKNTTGIIYSPVRQMLSLVNSSMTLIMTLVTDSVKQGQIWSLRSSLSDVKNAKNAENALNLSHTNKPLCGVCASFGLAGKQESYLARANAGLYVTVNPHDKGIRRPQILDNV